MLQYSLHLCIFLPHVVYCKCRLVSTLPRGEEYCEELLHGCSQDETEQEIQVLMLWASEVSIVPSKLQLRYGRPKDKGEIFAACRLLLLICCIK